MTKLYICRNNGAIRQECDWVIKNPAFEPLSDEEAVKLGFAKKAPTSKPKPKAKAKAKPKPADTASTDDDIDGVLDGVDD